MDINKNNFPAPYDTLVLCTCLRVGARALLCQRKFDGKTIFIRGAGAQILSAINLKSNDETFIASVRTPSNCKAFTDNKNKSIFFTLATCLFS